MFSIFEYVDGVFQLNVWGAVIVAAFISALGTRAQFRRR